VSASDAILFGSSLGAAVALQAAAIEPRVRGVIAQSTFSDLDAIAQDRRPWIATAAEVEGALALAEQRGRFRVAGVSPRTAATHLRMPVLLIHGDADTETRPEHSRRVFDALAGPKRLILVAGAGHNDVLAREWVWVEIERWLARIGPASPPS
jgi:pimeloyl-ACP methyl ester carboxylesterase